MLVIEVPERRLWDEKNLMFIQSKGATLQLEHSLLSLQKWEAIHKKPFLSKEAKSLEETKSYVKCMTINKNVPSDVYDALTDAEYSKINAYINESRSAAFFNEEDSRTKYNSEQITADLIYYWMIALNIPFECKTWHLDQLFKLIKICNIKNSPPKKHSMNEIYARNNALNAKRKAKAKSRRR